MPIESTTRGVVRKVAVINSKNNTKIKRIKRKRGAYYLRLNGKQ